jgi:hypothetical protein
VPDRFYGVPLGGQLPVNVTEAASTTSAVVELRINDTVYTNKPQVLAAIEALKNYVQTKETSPIA